MGNYGIYNQPSPRANREIRVIHPRTIWEIQVCRGAPTNLARIPGRRNDRFSKTGKHPQGTPGWQLSQQGPVTLVPGGHLPANPRTPEASPPMNRPGTGTDRRGHLPRKKTSPPRGTWNVKQPDGRHLPRDTWSNKRLGFKPL